MADAVGVVSEAVGFVMGITSLVANINDAVDTVRQNKEDCLDIKKRVQRINLTLSLLKGREELMKNQAISRATEALNETLVSARVLIADCQQKRAIMCVYLQAGNISKQLSKMDQLISNTNIDVAVAILASQRSEMTAHPLRINPMVASLSKRTDQYVSPSPSSIPNPSERRIEVDVSDITQMPEICDNGTNQQYHDCLKVEKFKKMEQRIDEQKLSSIPRGVYKRRTTHIQHGFEVLELGQFGSRFVIMEPTSKRHCSEIAHSPAAQLRIVLHETSNVAERINEATGTVRQNIEECTALGERVNSLSHVLELAHMEKVKDPAMNCALDKLRQAFERANTLIMECHKPKTTILRRLIMGHSKPKRKLSKEICEVSDQMVLAVYNIISIILPYENAPKAFQLQEYPTLVDSLSFTGPSSRPGPLSASTSRSSSMAN